MNVTEYLEKLDDLDSLEVRVRKLDGRYRQYRDGFLSILNQLREIYDNELIESGDYPRV